MEYTDVTGDFDDFYKLVKDGDIDDPLDKCIMYLKELLDVMKTGFTELNETMGGEVPEAKEEVQSGFGNIDSAGGHDDREAGRDHPLKPLQPPTVERTMAFHPSRLSHWL